MKKLMILAAVCLLPAMNSMAQTTDKLYIDNFSINAGETKAISINLTNTENEYLAFQFDLDLPEGISIDYTIKKGKVVYTASLNEDRMDDHVLTVSQLEDGESNPLPGKYRLLAYSNTNSKFWENSGELINITLVAASDITGGEVSGLLHSITFTNTDPTPKTINFSDAAFTVTATTSINEIEMSNDKPATIYDLKGNIIRKNATSTEGLSKGVYIIDNKKVIVK